MIRVLHVLPRLRRGGSQAFVMNLYRNIDRTQIQFDFIIFTKDKDDYYEEIQSLGGRVYHFEKFNGVNYFKIKKSFEVFLSEHPEYKIMHIHVYSTASLYIPIAKKHGLKTIIHSHSTSNGKGLLSVVKGIMQLPLKRIADYLFACSTEAGKWLYGKNALKKQNYKFIPNGIDVASFGYSEKDRLAIRKRYNIEKDCYVIGHVGGFEKPKNHKFIIKTFESVIKKDSACKLMLVGDGTYLKGIKDYCKKNNLENNVIFTNLQEDVSPFLSAMDVFFFPSLWEGLPVSVLEAEASGLPCLLSSVITRDCAVSTNIEYLPLKVDWVDKILSYKGRTRLGLDLETSKLMAFDVRNVSRELAAFYLEIGYGTR